MPYQVLCPKCSTKLKSKRPVPAGRNLTCPQCKYAFTLTEDAAEVDTQPISTRPAAPTGREDVKPGRGSKPDLDDLESQDIVDAADFDRSGRAKSKRRDDDDRPRSRDRRDEGDDRPSRRKGRVADDYDREGDRSPDRKKKPNKALIIGIIAGGAGLMFVLLLVLCLVWDPFSFFGGGGASSDMLVWVPSEMQGLEGADVTEVSKNTKMMGNIRDDVKEAENVGIKLEDMSSFLLAKRTAKGPYEIYVIKLKNSADKDKIIKAAGGQEATASGKKYYKTKGNGALYFASDKLVVLAKSENTFTPLLAKDSGKVVITDELKSAVKKADGQLWSAAVGSDCDMFAGMGKGAGPGFSGPPPAKSSIMTANLAGNDVNMKFENTYADADSANKAKTAIETFFNLVKLFEAPGKKGPDPKMEGTKKMFESAKFEVSGTVLTIRMIASVDTFEDFGKSSK